MTLVEGDVGVFRTGAKTESGAKMMMTTERYAWASKRALADRTWGMVLPMCGCGQALDYCAAASCPRCGTKLQRDAA